MSVSRREACLLISAAMAATTGSAIAKSRVSSGALPSKVYDFDKLHANRSADHIGYPILEGKTHTGFGIELHETALPPGGQPHPPHRHTEEELFLIREGTPEVTIDGKTSKLPPGSVAYIASNALHGIRNTGSGWARYFVMQLNAK
jgi:quercetin dioxygenase-like cupin family protein